MGNINYSLIQHDFASHTKKDNFIAVKNKANVLDIAYIYAINESELLEIIKKSHIAQKQWAELLAIERADIMMRWYALMLENKQDLATILTEEMGKPISEALGEITYAANFIRYFAEESRRIEGDIIQPVQKGQKIFVIKQPVGVCGAITPWNFPSAMITRKVAPALACGCSMIIKPATQTPLSAFALQNLAYKAGVPKDLLQVVTGDTTMISRVLCDSDIVKKISFTGSTEIGKKLITQSANNVKKLSLELGGNAPFIVFDDANLDSALQGIIASKFRNTGQTCVCANRIYAHNDIYEELATRLKHEVEKLKVGNGMDSGVTQGPLINNKALEKVESHILDATSKGAIILTGGKRHEIGGNFFYPTILTNVTSNMLLAREETFGPVAPMFRFSTDSEAIHMANDTEYGLVAYVYTKNMKRIWQLSEALEYGIIGTNTGIISTEVAPFGGVKQSGFGREGSKYGMQDYLDIKYMCVNLE